MWVYRQTDGALSDKTGQTIAHGYSGHAEGKNNPAMQSHQGLGPIPIGTYNIFPPTDTASHGPYVMRLEPHAENEMFGRSGFLIHGDSVKAPGTASLGCIILPRVNRVQIWESGDHLLGVEL